MALSRERWHLMERGCVKEGSLTKGRVITGKSPQ